MFLFSNQATTPLDAEAKKAKTEQALAGLDAKAEAEAGRVRKCCT